ncbi:hypothetical protein VCUG_01526 [Vavraia culicis subsp. floridensis]|uniref:Uncharacterized protein n=1 Tax=Vavraia culicis (isolate floridensis) TaxID=948595 RepID=L2GV80_VAVCU|nr:uncharacterized protein VCUG_01526 [Vavraia culicis subsp. floridensis]ELA46995.1 hypothetical protein VCUG_01526 [Vavraia culicis subsp. floridensis]
MRFGLYFSVKQEDSTEPPGGLNVSIDETSIEMVKCIFAKYRIMFLKLVVRRLLEDLSDLRDMIQQFYFITDLYLHNLTHEYTDRIYEPHRTVQDFINIEKTPKLRTLTIIRMIVADEFLEKVSNTALENLTFTECIFLTSEGTEKQPKKIKLAFGESYKAVCFDMCGIYIEDIKSQTICQSHHATIIIELSNCINLRTLTVNSGRYVNVVLRNKK